MNDFYFFITNAYMRHLISNPRHILCLCANYNPKPFPFVFARNSTMCDNEELCEPELGLRALCLIVVGGIKNDLTEFIQSEYGSTVVREPRVLLELHDRLCASLLCDETDAVEQILEINPSSLFSENDESISFFDRVCQYHFLGEGSGRLLLDKKILEDALANQCATKRSFSSLYYASAGNMQVLLDAGFGEFKDCDGNTALHYLFKHKQIDRCYELITKKPDLQYIENKQGIPAFFEIVHWNFTKPGLVLKFAPLIDVLILSNDGMSIYQYAARQGADAVDNIRYLHEAHSLFKLAKEKVAREEESVKGTKVHVETFSYLPPAKIAEMGAAFRSMVEKEADAFYAQMKRLSVADDSTREEVIAKLSRDYSELLQEVVRCEGMTKTTVGTSIMNTFFTTNTMFSKEHNVVSATCMVSLKDPFMLMFPDSLIFKFDGFKGIPTTHVEVDVLAQFNFERAARNLPPVDNFAQESARHQRHMLNGIYKNAKSRGFTQVTIGDDGDSATEWRVTPTSTIIINVSKSHTSCDEYDPNRAPDPIHMMIVLNCIFARECVHGDDDVTRRKLEKARKLAAKGNLYSDYMKLFCNL